MVSVALVIGTRPQIIKASAIVREAQKHKIDVHIIQTGQHYDYEMTQIFLEEFKMPDNYVNLGVGSGTHCWQIATMITRLEETLAKQSADLVLVLGDTNSTLAGALSSSMLRIPLAHVEAGARSYDMTMPEEVNRRLTDHVSSLLFAPTENCKRNLIKENIPEELIFLVGDIMLDVLLSNKNLMEQNGIVRELGLEEEEYAILTLHRPSNLVPKKIRNLMVSIKNSNLRTVFPIHPRTRKELEKMGLESPANLLISKPLGYLEMMKLLSKARILITDSGGLQKESFWLNIPCLTLRKNTEWPETVELGANELVGEEFKNLAGKIEQRLEKPSATRNRLNPFGDGKASKRIIEVILSHA